MEILSNGLMLLLCISSCIYISIVLQFFFLTRIEFHYVFLDSVLKKLVNIQSALSSPDVIRFPMLMQANEDRLS